MQHDDDEDDGLEFKSIMSRAKRKTDVRTILNKRYVSQEELDNVFLGE